MRLHVEVTAEDIAAGVRSNGCECPVARALSRASGRVAFVNCISARFGASTAAAIHDYDSLVGLPRNVQQFAMAFDGGDAVDPVSFDLNIPDATVSP